MTSTSRSTWPEDASLSADDRPGRFNARVDMVVCLLGPEGKRLLAEIPALQWCASDLKAVLVAYAKHRDAAAKLMDGNLEPGHLSVIDRHKIGAAFALAILEVAPLKLEAGASPSLEGQQLANAVLAFRMAIRVLATFSSIQARKTNDAALAARWRRAVVYPKPRPQVPGDFRHHAYRALEHAYRQGRLNLPVLANWLFVIEQYNNQANP